MIYLDYNASTPVDPAVREAMLPFLGEHYGNPSSNHLKGFAVRKAVDKARQQVASLINAKPDEIVFTSGGTEANNHVIKSVAFSRRERGNHIITSAIEHPAVINPCRWLERMGFEISYVPVDSTGLIDPMSVLKEIRSTTTLISIMHANNEVGTIQPIDDIAEIAREGGIYFHTDAAQSCGKIKTDVQELGVDFLSIAGHKLYAPQGIGALYIRRDITLEPLHHGAGHENGRRAGTEPVPAIVGLGQAAVLAKRSLDTTNGLDAAESMNTTNGMKSMNNVLALRDRFKDTLGEELGKDVVLLGHSEKCLPNTAAVAFPNKNGAEILAACPEICASVGAACHSSGVPLVAGQPVHLVHPSTGRRTAGDTPRLAVLDAMNVPDEIAMGAIRFSLGRYTTEQEITTVAQLIIKTVRAM